MITENLSTLKIHKLTQAQYDRELAAGNIDANALYLTPDEEADLSEYATIKYVDNAFANIDVSEQVNTAISNIDNLVYTSEENQESATVPLNADTLQGKAASAFAPSGFGLGSTGRYVADMHAVTPCGWFWTNAETVNAPMRYCQGITIQRTSNECVYLAWGVNSNDGMVQVKTNDRGVTWITEWINPPMVAGVEYRTTERFNGKPVYAKVIDMGAMPKATLKEVSHGIDNVKHIIDLRIFARDESRNMLYVPSTTGTDTTLTAASGASRTTVWVTTETDRSVMSGYALLKYIKTTD